MSAPNEAVERIMEAIEAAVWRWHDPDKSDAMVDTIEAEFATLEAENERLRKALEHYAGPGEVWLSGERAREALKK